MGPHQARGHLLSLTLAGVAHYPLPGTSAPSSIAFSPDGKWLTWLHSPARTLTLELFGLDLGSGERGRLMEPPEGVTEEALTLEEKLRRERARDLSLGVSRYRWARDANRMVIPLPAGVYVYDTGDRSLRLAVERGDHAIEDPHLSPDGRLLAYVQDAELYMVEVDATHSTPRQVTSGAGGTGRTHGLAEFIAQEEMGRSSGFWWSRDSKWLAFAEVDETHIPVYRIVHQGSDQVGVGAEEDHRYPFAGCDNAIVSLWVVELQTGDTRQVVDAGDGYLARVDWLPDGGLAVQVENRAQTRLELLRVDPVEGTSTTLLVEESDVWINLHDHFRPLEGGRFLWSSERSGYRHLEVHAADGSLERVLTEGEWVVTSLDGVDETEGVVWFTATLDGPVERHLYEVPLAGGPVRRITDRAGTHSVVVDKTTGLFVDTFSSTAQPPVVAVRRLADGSVVHVLHDDVDPAVEAAGLTPPELTTVRSRDGAVLHAAVYRPEGEGPFPTMVSVYGGPHAQRVVDAWSTTVSLRAQYLRQQGYCVIAVDNRGSANRGLAFEGALRWDMGHVEVDDQVDAVRAFVEAGLVDAGRVGIYGWSYGGYMSALCLAKAPDVFRLAVAGAPVASWDGYDTHYTERYMGTPAANPDGYRSSSVLTHATGIRGALMLVHGLIDENVHFRHTARLQNALIAARIPAELLLFPDERHVPRHEKDRIYMEERIMDFVARNLRS